MIKNDIKLTQSFIFILIFMQKKYSIFFLVFIFLNSFYEIAHAYFDPVTTTTILQGLFAIVAAIILYIRNPKKIIIDLKNLFSKNKNIDDVGENDPEKKD